MPPVKSGALVNALYQGCTQDFSRGGVLVVVKDIALKACGEILQNHAH